jgi:hypothetical protein
MLMGESVYPFNTNSCRLLLLLREEGSEGKSKQNGGGQDRKNGGQEKRKRGKPSGNPQATPDAAVSNTLT